MLSFLLLYMSCSSQDILLDSASSKEPITPVSDQNEFLIFVGGETRFIIEGSFVEASLPDETNQIDIIFGTYSTASTLEIYLFENDSPEAIWGKELSGETAAIYNYVQECFSGCTTKIIGKALHTQGSEDITLKLEARTSREEGQIQISPLY